MREFTPPEKADILVSELLGSFGDNELSPECLDGAQKFLKEDGISIPSQYTSYLCPVQTSKLYNEVRAHADKDKNYIKSFETPYVVHQQNRMELSTTMPLFQFNHPNRGTIEVTSLVAFESSDFYFCSEIVLVTLMHSKIRRISRSVRSFQLPT